MEKIGRDVPNKQHIEPTEIWRSNDQKMRKCVSRKLRKPFLRMV